MQHDILEELYIKHYREAFAYIFSLSKNNELTEDIVSQGFEKALITVDDSIPNFRYWLVVVCRNLWLDYIRKDKKRSHTAFDDLNIVANENVFDEVADSIDNINLYKAIDRLSQSDKEMICLFYFSQLQIKDIGRIFNISETNTKVKLHRARLKLKKIMEEQNNGF